MSQVHVAIAILHHHDQFLMQLRDDLDTIIFPGCWGFFGGHIEPGEDPDTAVHRELWEEIGYQPSNLEPFQVYATEQSIRHVYQAPLLVPLTDLTLQEGQDLRLVSIDEVRQGESFSDRLQEMRRLAPPSRLILLEFWEQRMGSPTSHV